MQVARAVFNRIKAQNRATLALSETEAATQDRLLIAQHIVRFANQASLQLSGYDANDGRSRSKVISGMNLSPAQIRKAKRLLMKSGASRSLPDAICFKEIIRILRVAIVSDLSDEELTCLATRVEGVQVDVGQSVFQIGDVGDRFYIVLSGCLSVHILAGTDDQLVQIGVLSSGMQSGSHPAKRTYPHPYSDCGSCRPRIWGALHPGQRAPKGNSSRHAALAAGRHGRHDLQLDDTGALRQKASRQGGVFHAFTAV